MPRHTHTHTYTRTLTQPTQRDCAAKSDVIFHHKERGDNRICRWWRCLMSLSLSPFVCVWLWLWVCLCVCVPAAHVFLTITQCLDNGTFYTLLLCLFATGQSLNWSRFAQRQKASLTCDKHSTPGWCRARRGGVWGGRGVLRKQGWVQRQKKEKHLGRKSLLTLSVEQRALHVSGYRLLSLLQSPLPFSLPLSYSLSVSLWVDKNSSLSSARLWGNQSKNSKDIFEVFCRFSNPS